MEWILLGIALIVLLVIQGGRSEGKGSRASSKGRKAASTFRTSSSRPDGSHSVAEGSTGFRPSQGGAPYRSDSYATIRSPTDSAREPARWIAPGKHVEIAGIQITSGMIYVGGVLASPNGYGPDKCLIDPASKVSRTHPDVQGRSMPYWPSYSDIQPTARRAYLEWLAGGRKDPTTGIGYVFLFFYGLERRLFVDEARHEAGAITAEVRRLLSIYGGNGSFRGYATKLLDAAMLLEGPPAAPPALSPDLRNGYEIPLPVRIHLGRRLADRLPLEAEDALLWLLSLPDTNLRTPAVRCFEEFVPLWKARFGERHPGGLRVSSPKTPLKSRYRAASGTFDLTLDIGVNGSSLPDVAAVSAPLDGLRDLASACTEELESYSRLLGRRPGSRGTAEALVLLPKALLDHADASPLRDLANRLEALFRGRATAPVRASELLDVLGMSSAAGGKISAAMCGQIGRLLDRVDVAFEPDRRYGPTGLAPDGNAILFRAPDGAPVDGERPTYKAATTLIEITALAASIDGDVSDAEMDGIKGDLQSLPDLSSVDRSRLLALAALALRDRPRQGAVMSRISKLPEHQRRQVARSAVSAVLADGHASPAEVKFLEKLHKTLGYPVDDVYAALHRGSVVIDEPIVVAAAETLAGIPIPSVRTQSTGAVLIDAARLERIRGETSAVSALLAGIFVEDEAVLRAPPPPTTSRPTRVAAFQGLDDAHGELLAVVLVGDTLPRSSFEERARALRLLPDGAMETINEWAFDRFDEALLEGDEIISVPDHLRTELRQLEAAA